MSEVEQGRLGKADQRRPQHRPQGQIVLRQQQELTERHQVHHRELVGQHHAIDAGDRTSRCLSSRISSSTKLVRRRTRTMMSPGRTVRSRAGRRSTPIIAAMRAAMRRASRADGESPATRRTGGAQAGGSVRANGNHWRPQLDQPGLPGAVRAVGDRAAVEADAVGRRRRREDAIDGGQHGAGRAEGDRQRHVVPVPGGGPGATAEMVAHGGKGRRVGTLKAEDRLLDVADREDGADLPGAPLGR